MDRTPVCVKVHKNTTSIKIIVINTRKTFYCRQQNESNGAKETKIIIFTSVLIFFSSILRCLIFTAFLYLFRSFADSFTHSFVIWMIIIVVAGRIIATIMKFIVSFQFFLLLSPLWSDCRSYVCATLPCISPMHFCVLSKLQPHPLCSYFRLFRFCCFSAVSSSLFYAANDLTDIYAEGIVSSEGLGKRCKRCKRRHSNTINDHRISSGAFIIVCSFIASPVCLRVYLKTGYYIRFQSTKTYWALVSL